MRKVLLATTAFVAFAAAGAAQAATTSPLTVNVGGSTDFVAGAFAESNRGTTSNGLSSSNRDFETVYDIDFSVAGKMGNGVEYGGMLGLTNAQDISNGFNGTQSPYANVADVFLSGALGKVVLGDSHGATDLSVGAPTVGEGQVEGRYVDFLDVGAFAKNFVYGVDGTDHSTNVTYFTPKFGTENNKLQAGVSYIPQFYNYGSSVVKYDNGVSTNTNTNTLSPYKDVFKGALAYTGSLAPVALKASANMIHGSSNQVGSNTAWNVNAPGVQNAQSFTSWGIGGQAALDGFTLGAGYTDLGHYDAVAGQGRNQNTYTAGLKYELNKLAVGVSYLGGEGYSNMLTSGATGANLDNYNYVKDFNSYGAGGTYTWAPGLTSNLDGVVFDQKTDSNVENKGYVLLVSQKLAF